MTFQSQAENAEHNKIPLVNPNAQVKKSSLQYQAPRLSNEKASSLGAPRLSNKNVSSLGERKPLKPGKTVEQKCPDQGAATTDKISIGNSIPVIPSGNNHKPWPSRKVTGGGDDVVKYMSSVPSYLQRLEKGDSVQEKALNFGVLDWGRLEKWTCLQKQVANRRGRDSPSSTNSSPATSFSSFGSSSQFTRSIDSPFAQRKQSPPLNAYQNSSVEGRETEWADEQNSVQIMSNLDSKTSHSRQSGKAKIKYSNKKSIFVDKPQHSEFGSASSTSEVNDIPDFAHNKVKSQIDTSRGEGKFHNCEQKSFPGDLYSTEDWQQDRCSVVEGMWDCLQESEHARHSSHDSATVSNGRSVGVSRKSFSGDFPHSDYQFASQPLHFPYSCPLPSNSQNDEPSISSTLLSKNEVIRASVQGNHMNLGQSTVCLSEKSVSNMVDNSGQGVVEVAAAPRRELSPHHLLSAGLNRMRSSILREGSSRQQMKQPIISSNSHEDNATSHRRNRCSATPHRLSSAGLNHIRNSSLREDSSGVEMDQTICSNNSREENAASSSRSRHSPLRRIFDPLLKPKKQIHFCGPDTSLSSYREFSNGDKLPIQVELNSADEPCKSSDADINPLRRQVPEACCSVQAEKPVISSRRALLKLAWKNELPLFVFSANDNEILAATMGKGNISQKNDFSCSYTMFTAHELKKKGGVWMGQGNKGRNRDLVYNVVGQMRVSSSKSTSIGSEDYFVMREFVLFGKELAPTTHGCVNSPFNSELVAIVIQVPNERSENSDVQGNNSKESSQINSVENKNSTRNMHAEQQNENSGLANVVAILPRGVHGISSNGEPSPLIERWKSGGSCDCGGWDEGCMLTVLTDKIQESRSSSSSRACSAFDTPQIELFLQGEDRENKHLFRMTAHREGVYTIEFGPSIASVQAFAMSIAILHSRKPHTLSGLYYSMKARSIQEHSFTKNMSIASGNTQTGAPTSYLPDCPPLSPVRRA